VDIPVNSAPALDDVEPTELELFILDATLETIELLATLDLIELEEAMLDLTELELTATELEDLSELLDELATDEVLSPTTP